MDYFLIGEALEWKQLGIIYIYVYICNYNQKLENQYVTVPMNENKMYKQDIYNKIKINPWQR